MVEDGILHVIFHMVAEEWLSVQDHLSLLNVDRHVLADLALVRQRVYLVQYREDIEEVELFEEDNRRLTQEVLRDQRRAERRRPHRRRWHVDFGMSSTSSSSDDWSPHSD